MKEKVMGARLKRGFLSLAALTLATFGFAQTNNIYVDVADYGLAPQRTTVTWTLVSPRPRTFNGVFITQQPVSAQSGTNGRAWFTNVIWGTYMQSIAGTPSTSFPLYVGTNTVGVVNAATLWTNSAAVPPNTATNYYTQAQIDSIVASMVMGTANTNGLAGTSYVNAAVAPLLLTNRVTTIVFTNPSAYQLAGGLFYGDGAGLTNLNGAGVYPGSLNSNAMDTASLALFTSQGRNGTNGLNGLNGTNGLNGLNGTNGLNGLNGPQGIPGTNAAVGLVTNQFTTNSTITLASFDVAGAGTLAASTKANTNAPTIYNGIFAGGSFTGDGGGLSNITGLAGAAQTSGLTWTNESQFTNAVANIPYGIFALIAVQGKQYQYFPISDNGFSALAIAPGGVYVTQIGADEVIESYAASDDLQIALTSGEMIAGGVFGDVTLNFVTNSAVVTTFSDGATFTNYVTPFFIAHETAGPGPLTNISIHVVTNTGAMYATMVRFCGAQNYYFATNVGLVTNQFTTNSTITLASFDAAGKAWTTNANQSDLSGIKSGSYVLNTIGGISFQADTESHPIQSTNSGAIIGDAVDFTGLNYEGSHGFGLASKNSPTVLFGKAFTFYDSTQTGPPYHSGSQPIGFRYFSNGATVPGTMDFRDAVLNGNGSGLTNIPPAGLQTNALLALWPNLTNTTGSVQTNIAADAVTNLAARLNSGEYAFTGNGVGLTNLSGTNFNLAWGLGGQFLGISKGSIHWAGLFGDGSLLTNICATNISFGTFTGNGSGLTNIAASNIFAGGQIPIGTLFDTNSGGAGYLLTDSGGTRHQTFNGQSLTNLAAANVQITTTPTLLIFPGDSRTVTGFGQNGLTYDYWLTNDFLPPPTWIYATNCAVAGQTLQQQLTLYATQVGPWLTNRGAGTNAWVSLLTCINDIYGGRTALQVEYDYSNYASQVKAAGGSFLAHTAYTETTADWASVPGREQTLTDVNAWIRQNHGLWTALADDAQCVAYMRTNGSNPISYDGIHPLPALSRALARVAYQAIRGNEVPQNLDGPFNLTISNAFLGTFTGNGKGLTNLNASSLTSGTVPASQLPPGLTNTVYIVSKGAYSTIAAAFIASAAGDTIRVMPGWYNEGTNTFVMKANQTLTFDPGAILYSTYVGTSAVLQPADNCTLYGPTVYCNPGAGQSAFPIGIMNSFSTFTNVVIYNSVVTNDVEGYLLCSSNASSWTLVNPYARTASDTYAQGYCSSNSATIINPSFHPDFADNIQGNPVKRCICTLNGGGGTINVFGGVLDFSGSLSNSTQGSVCVCATDKYSHINLFGTMFNNPDALTNSTVSFDCMHSFTSAALATNYILLVDCHRVDGLPMVKRNYNSFPVSSNVVSFATVEANTGSASRPGIEFRSFSGKWSGTGLASLLSSDIQFVINTNPIALWRTNSTTATDQLTNTMVGGNYQTWVSTVSPTAAQVGANGFTLQVSNSVPFGLKSTDSSTVTTNPIALQNESFSASKVSSTCSNALALTALSFPATTVTWTNTFGKNIFVFIDNTGVTGTACAVNGTQIFGSILPVDVTIPLQPGEYFSEVYSVGTPTAYWKPF